MVDLLVISHACFTAINRNIYHLFQNDGWNVELVVPKTLQYPSGTKQANPPMPGDPPIHYCELKGSNPRTYLFDGLMDLLNKKRPKIVLLDNDPVSRLALIIGNWCKKNNSRLFCVSCENLSLDIMATVKRRGLKSLPPAIIKQWWLHKSKRVVDGVFCINSDGRKIFMREGFSQVQQIPLGFDPNYFFLNNQARSELRSRLWLEKKVIAYFGRVVRQKGIHILINALKELKHYDWHLMMDDFDVFASPYNQEIKILLEQAGIIDRVVFIKPDHFEIAGYMNAADIVVVPSISTQVWKEQYGRVAAEAMACGRVVVASDSGALPELLNGHGYVFPEGNVEALHRLLERILLEENTTNKLLNPEVIAEYAKTSLSLLKQKEIMTTSFGYEINGDRIG